MIILAIETSCDDTCLAIVKVSNKTRPRFKILSNIISSQVKIHKKWGGIYPALAKREHQRNLPLVLKRALKEAKSPKIDLIAVTIGPGLEPCLWVGVNFAKALAYFWNLPIVPINHIESHILANLLPPIRSKLKIENQKSKIQIKNKKIEFPAICLIVSGGHTQLILMKDFRKYKILGETRDDAAGECFDKVARILGLGYPGGPIIEALVSMKSKVSRQSRDPDLSGKTQKSKVSLPRPMIHQENYDFSFSGLKTAVLYNFKTQSPKIRKSKEYIRETAKEVQQAIIEVLIRKTIKAAKEFKVKSIILGGGVAANDELRKQFRSNVSLSQIFKENLGRQGFLVPPKIFCTDNAAMVALAGYYHWLRQKKKNWKDIEAKANLRLE